MRPTLPKPRGELPLLYGTGLEDAKRAVWKRLDMRRIMRKSVATGGEPLQLLRRRRPERPVHLVSILDVSGQCSYAGCFYPYKRINRK